MVPGKAAPAPKTTIAAAPAKVAAPTPDKKTAAKSDVPAIKPEVKPAPSVEAAKTDKTDKAEEKEKIASTR